MREGPISEGPGRLKVEEQINATAGNAEQLTLALGEAVIRIWSYTEVAVSHR